MSDPSAPSAADWILALRPNATDPAPRPMPRAFSSLWRVGKSSSWDEALELLQGAGFKIAALVTRPKIDWPDDADPMGPAPEPRPAAELGDHERERHFALLSHPEGFIVNLNSYFSRGRHTLNQLALHYQVDVGAEIHSVQREAFGSRRTTYLHDGSSVISGDSEVVTGHSGPLASSLTDCYKEARPLPLDQWDPQFFYVSPELYTPAPPEAARSYSSSPVMDRFADRVAADWTAFLESLPFEVARVVDYEQTVVTRAPVGPSSRPLPAVHAYMARQLKTMGRNWPSAGDTALVAAWSEALSLAFAPKDPVALSLSSPGSRALGGANALHLLANAQPDRYSDRPADQDPALLWIKAQSRANLAQWLSERDAEGSTPIGVAFNAALAHARGYGIDSPLTPLISFFMDEGWLAASAPLPGGSNALHLLASVPIRPSPQSSADQARVVDWVKAQDPALIARWLHERDAEGLTPVGVALKASLPKARSGAHAPPLTALTLYFMEQGWMGAPGELGQVIHDAVAPHKPAFQDQRPIFDLSHAKLLDFIETRSREAGHSWAAPIRAPSGILATPAEGIGALLAKLGPVEGPTQAYVEALALRVSIDSPKPPASPSPSGLRI